MDIKPSTMADMKKKGNENSEKEGNSVKKIKIVQDELYLNNMKNVKKRIILIIRVICAHVFSAPFLEITNNNKEEKEVRTFEDVLIGVMNDRFRTVEEVFKELSDIIEETVIAYPQQKKLKILSCGLRFTQDDVSIMAAILRRKLNMFKNIFLPTEAMSKQSLIPHEKTTNKVKYSDFQSPIRNIYNPSIDIHFYIAAYYFYKMIESESSPIATRRLKDLNKAIKSIEYIENERLELAYETQKRKFQEECKLEKDGKVKELFLFHGTSENAAGRISKQNFIIETESEMRKKPMYFGRGVYFSEYPALSLRYGSTLLLSKVLPGRAQRFNPYGPIIPPIPEYYDSREVAPYGQNMFHIIKNTSQILPYCIIYINPECLTNELVNHVISCI